MKRLCGHVVIVVEQLRPCTKPSSSFVVRAFGRVPRHPNSHVAAALRSAPTKWCLSYFGEERKPKSPGQVSVGKPPQKSGEMSQLSWTGNAGTVQRLMVLQRECGMVDDEFDADMEVANQLGLGTDLDGCVTDGQRGGHNRPGCAGDIAPLG